MNVKVYIVPNNKATSITAMARNNNNLYCGLTADNNALSIFDIKEKIFTELVDIFPWYKKRTQSVLTKIHNGMHLLSDGRLLIGESILLSWDGQIILTGAGEGIDVFQENKNRRRKETGFTPIEKILATNRATFDYRELSGGKILIYDPKLRTSEIIGVPTSFDYIHSLVIDNVRKKAYGHTFPSCHFFVVDLDKKTVEDHNRISGTSFHNLVVSTDGILYGTWIDRTEKNNLRVLRFDPKKGYLERLPNVLMENINEKIGNHGFDQCLVHSNGDIYIGLAEDGCLYKFDTNKLQLYKIGGINTKERMPTLAEDEKGRILFTTGYPKASVGRYDPLKNKMEDFGIVADKVDPSLKHVYFHASVYADGILYLGETDGDVPALWTVEL